MKTGAKFCSRVRKASVNFLLCLGFLVLRRVRLRVLRHAGLTSPVRTKIGSCRVLGSSAPHQASVTSMPTMMMSLRIASGRFRWCRARASRLLATPCPV